MSTLQTRGVTRAILADGMDEKQFVIIKACARLRLTTEMRSASEFAKSTMREFILSVPSNCDVDAAVVGLVHSVGGRIVRSEG